MHPILIEIGPLTIRWYGVMIATACFIGLWVAGREAERKGIGKEKIQEFALYAIIAAIIGARIYYVLFSDLTQFLHKPLSIFAIWEGGLAIHGAILGGPYLQYHIFYQAKNIFLEICRHPGPFPDPGPGYRTDRLFSQRGCPWKSYASTLGVDLFP